MPSMDSTAGDRFVIEGGHPIGGEVTPSGNKNEALPLLAASLLVSGSVVIDNVPRIRDDAPPPALRGAGAHVTLDEADYRLKVSGRFRGTGVFLDEGGGAGTETAVVAAATADGRTRLLNAASEPHVQGLCHALNAMGARITGIGSNVLEIDRVGELHPARHRVGPDHIEVGSFVAVAAMTGGELCVREVAPDHLRMIRMVFARLGVETQIEGTALRVPAAQKRAIVADVDGAIPKVDDAPWPGFPADLTPLALVLATQCGGTVLIHEKLFESRLFFVDSLIAMGARIVLCDPHRALVIGPSRLHGATIVSPDIRAGMALIAAALAAPGRSVIRNVEQVDRGYERVDDRLRGLGARIVRE